MEGLQVVNLKDLNRKVERGYFTQCYWRFLPVAKKKTFERADLWEAVGTSGLTILLVSGNFGVRKSWLSTKENNICTDFIKCLVALLNSLIAELCHWFKRWACILGLWQYFFELHKIHLENHIISKEAMKCITELKCTLTL